MRETRKIDCPRTMTARSDTTPGYAIMHQDAVAAVVWAVRRDVAGKIAFN